MSVFGETASMAADGPCVRATLFGAQVVHGAIVLGASEILHYQLMRSKLWCLLLILFQLGNLALYYFIFDQASHSAEGSQLQIADCQKYQDHSLIYFHTPYQKYLHQFSCVKECPKERLKELSCKNSKLKDTCKANQNFKNLSNLYLIYPTVQYNNWVCLPLYPTYLNRIKRSIYVPPLQSLLHDSKAVKLPVLFVCLLSLLLALLFILFSQSKISVFLLVHGSYVALIISAIWLITAVNINGLIQLSDSMDPSMPQIVKNVMQNYNGHGQGIIILGTISLFCGIVMIAATYLNRAKLFILANFIAAFLKKLMLNKQVFLSMLLFFIVGVLLSVFYSTMIYFSLNIEELNENPRARLNQKEKLSTLSMAATGCAAILMYISFRFYSLCCSFVFSGYYTQVNYPGSQLKVYTRLWQKIDQMFKASLVMCLTSPFYFLYEIYCLFNANIMSQTNCLIIKINRARALACNQAVFLFMMDQTSYEQCSTLYIFESIRNHLIQTKIFLNMLVVTKVYFFILFFIWPVLLVAVSIALMKIVIISYSNVVIILLLVGVLQGQLLSNVLSSSMSTVWGNGWCLSQQGVFNKSLEEWINEYLKQTQDGQK